MLNYEDLEWFIMFPFLCGVMMWFSIDLALLVRIGGGRRRRKNVRVAIENMVLRAPVVVHRTSSPVGGGGGIAHGDRSPQRLSPPLKEASAHPSPKNGRAQRCRKIVDIPLAMHIATKAVTRRAVVVVGGDFARSPRMQYHAASLAQSGLFDEVVLVGLDCGNALSEALYQSGLAAPEVFYLDNPRDEEEVQRVVWERFRKPHDRRQRRQTGCLISTRYLIAPPAPPEWFQYLFPLRKLHWAACTLFRAAAFTLLYSWLLVRATAIRVNVHGQLLLTDLILVQTPPAIPFVPLVKFIVRPLSFLYSGFVYYVFIVPASWFNRSAVKELRELSQPLSHPVFSFAPEGPGPDASQTPPPSLNSSVNGSGSHHKSSSCPHRCRANHASHDGAAAAAPTATVVQRGGGRAVRVEGRLREWCCRRLAYRCVFWPSLVVDWHNLGYTILRAAHRPSLVTNTYKLLELHCCAGDVNLTVSEAMRHFLTENGVVPREGPVVRDGNDPLSPATAAVTTAGIGRLHALLCLHRYRRRAAAATVTRVLYDVAPSFFRPTSRKAFVDEVVVPMNQVTAALAALRQQAPPGEEGGWGISNPPAWLMEEVADASLGAGGPLAAAAAAARNPSEGTSNRKRGVMIVGSTSWTEDDDYSILVEALQRLDHRLRHEYKYLCNAPVAASSGRPPPPSSFASATAINPGGAAGSLLPVIRTPSPDSPTAQVERRATLPLDVWVLITGKGAARQRFEDSVRAAGLSSHVVVSTAYLQSYREYSMAIGAADVGLCLHFSSSGLDLPMKGVDMLGSGLPVAALAYPAIEELMGAPVGLSSAAGVRGRSGNGAGGGDGASLSSSSLPAGGLVECERGWLFSSAAALEKLLGSLVALDDLAGGNSGSDVLPPLRGHHPFGGPSPAVSADGNLNGGKASLSSAVSSVGGGGAVGIDLGVPLLSPANVSNAARLAAAQQRVRSGVHRTTWEEGWNETLKPILDEIL